MKTAFISTVSTNFALLSPALRVHLNAAVRLRKAITMRLLARNSTKS